MALSERVFERTHIERTAQLERVDVMAMQGIERAADQRVGAVADPAAHGNRLDGRQAGGAQRDIERMRDALGAVDQGTVEVES